MEKVRQGPMPPSDVLAMPCGRFDGVLLVFAGRTGRQNPANPIKPSGYSGWAAGRRSEALGSGQAIYAAGAHKALRGCLRAAPRPLRGGGGAAGQLPHKRLQHLGSPSELIVVHARQCGVDLGQQSSPVASTGGGIGAE